MYGARVRWRSKRAWIVAFLVVLLAWIGWSLARAPVVDVYRAERRDLVQTIVASGRVRPLSRVRLGSAIVGTVRTVHAREGAKVAAGEVLIELDDTEARGALVEARAALSDAEAQLEEAAQIQTPMATARLERARATLSRAETGFRRMKRLSSEGIASQEQLDVARQALAVARSEHDVARLDAVRLAEDGTQRQRAEAAVAQTRGALGSATARLEHTRIRAPGDGVVTTRDVEPGDAVQVGRVLMEIVLDAETQITAEPDERNLALLRPGQTARASADAFPERAFPARVVYISPGVDPQRGTIEVRLAVDHPPEYLRPDMTVSVEIEVARRVEALALPIEAVRDPATTAPWIMTIEKGHVTRRAVTLGARDEVWVEIVAGVDAGAAVVPSSTPDVSPGQRARAGRTMPVPASTS